MFFYLVNGYIKFPTHVVEHTLPNGDTHRIEFHDAEQKDKYVSVLDKRNISFTITELETPPQDLLDKYAGRTFTTKREAQMFVDGTLPKTELEILQETVDTLVLAALEVE